MGYSTKTSKENRWQEIQGGKALRRGASVGEQEFYDKEYLYFNQMSTKIENNELEKQMKQLKTKIKMLY